LDVQTRGFVFLLIVMLSSIPNAVYRLLDFDGWWTGDSFLSRADPAANYFRGRELDGKSPPTVRVTIWLSVTQLVVFALLIAILMISFLTGHYGAS